MYIETLISDCIIHAWEILPVGYLLCTRSDAKVKMSHIHLHLCVVQSFI